jgi:hypothetical protein
MGRECACSRYRTQAPRLSAGRISHILRFFCPAVFNIKVLNLFLVVLVEGLLFCGQAGFSFFQQALGWPQRLWAPPCFSSG